MARHVGRHVHRRLARRGGEVDRVGGPALRAGPVGRGLDERDVVPLKGGKGEELPAVAELVVEELPPMPRRAADARPAGARVQLWYADSAQVEGMGGCILGWGVFGPFRNLTTDSSMGNYEGSTRSRSAQVGYLQKTTLQPTQHRQQPPHTLPQFVQLKISLVMHLNSW